MRYKPGGTNRKGDTMAGQDTRRFLERLASDDAFRAEVERNPFAALKVHGLHVDPAKLPVQGVNLPSKEAVRQSLDEHVAALDDSSALIMFRD
jgi:putative modified peptide